MINPIILKLVARWQPKLDGRKLLNCWLDNTSNLYNFQTITSECHWLKFRLMFLDLVDLIFVFLQSSCFPITFSEYALTITRSSFNSNCGAVSAGAKP